MNQWYRSCEKCGVIMIVKGPASPLTTCSACFLGQRAGKRYTSNVTLIKPGERMNDEKKVGLLKDVPVVATNSSLPPGTFQPPRPLSQQAQGIGKGAPGLKDDGGKLMWNLLPWKATHGLIKVLTFGAKKYSPNGWRSVPDAQQRYLAALLRHLYAVNAGEKLDPESGLRHIDHIMCNAAFLAELED